MSRRVRNFLTRLICFFERHLSSLRSTPSSSNADVPPTGPPPNLQQLPTPLHSHPSNLSNKPLPPTPFLVIPPLQPLTPSISQPPTLPPTTQCALQALSVPLHPVNCEPGPSHLAVPPPGSEAYAQRPSNPTPQLSIPGQTHPSSLPLASRGPTRQPQTPTGFAGAHDFVINDPQFIDISLGRPGLKELLNRSMPDAFHNSAARYPPPKCHLGTRNGYITKITDWALESSHRHEPILWMCGPFGVGKSAVAQSCAEALYSQNKLAAALFFSRSNADRDDPRRVFTSIAYQIATICPPFRDIVDTCICNDPALATKSLSTQFRELLVHPLQQIDVVRNGMGGRVVVIDGLDECRVTSGQREIIDVIAASIRNRTTPFRWFITSRPEDPIIRTMNSSAIYPISYHLELPVSRKIDHEILIYLTDEFEKIRRHHRLAQSWPSEAVLALLVDRTAGLWVYATTIVRFVADESGFGPEDQLRIVLAFLKAVSAKVGLVNPLTEMDFFYTLIVQRVPLKIRTIIRKICLLHSFVRPWGPERIAIILGLSQGQFRRSCASIQSVMKLQGSGTCSMRLHFYHTSFLDFMKTPERSKELCIYGDFLIEYRRERLDWLHQVCSNSTGPSHLVFSSETAPPEGWNPVEYYSVNLGCFWDLCSVPGHRFDSQTAAFLEKLKFRMMLRLTGKSGCFLTSEERQHIRDNLPAKFRNKIIRKGKCPTPGCTNTENVWIFGRGKNETPALRDSSGGLRLTNNQNPDPGWCFCGSEIRHRRLSIKL